MTASQRTHATSDNSVPRSSRVGTENITPQRGPRHRSIAQYINNRNGAVTATSEIAIEVGGIHEGISGYISQTQTTNSVQQLDSLQGLVLVLTAKGEHFVQEVDL